MLAYFAPQPCALPGERCNLSTAQLRTLALRSLLNVLRRALAQVSQLFRLSSVQSWRDGKCSIHAHDAGIEIEFGNPLETARGTFLDTDAAPFAVVDQNLVHAVRTLRTCNARFGTDQITVVAGVTGAAAETAARLLHRLFFRERLNHLILGLLSAGRRQQVLLDAGKMGE